MRYVFAVLVSFATVVPAHGQFQTVMLTGPNQIPQLDDGAFNDFSMLQMNNRGQIAFHSENKRDPLPDNEFISVWSGGEFSFFQEPNFELDEDEIRYELDDRGHLFFRTEFYVADDEETEGTWIWRGNSDYEPVAVTGTAYPGDPSRELFGGYAIPNRFGQSTVSTAILGEDGALQSVILLAEDTALTEIAARAGERINSVGAPPWEHAGKTYQPTLVGFGMNDQGQYMIRNDRDYWLGSGGLDGPREFVVSNVEPAAGTDSRFWRIGEFHLNNHGTIAHVGALRIEGDVNDSNNEGIWVFRPGVGSQLLLREGEQARGIAGARYGGIGNVALNDHEDILFQAEYRLAQPTSEGSALWLEGSTQQLLVQTGAPISILSAGEVVSSLGRAHLNNVRQIATSLVTQDESSGEAVSDGIYLRSFNGHWQEVISIGDELEVLPGISHTVESLRLISFNDLGQIAFVAGFEQDGASFSGVFLTDGVPCDLSGNGACDVTDLDRLVNGIVSARNDAALDITGDGSVDPFDLEVWLGRASVDNGLPASYRPGDANLDGVVDAVDLAAWRENNFTVDGSWSGGDFNADGVTDVSDFNLWNESFDAFAAATVPEPSIANTLLWLIMAVTAVLRQRKVTHLVCRT